MYKISVPQLVSNISRYGKEQTLEAIRRFDAERVFLAIEFYNLDRQKRKESLENLKEICEFFHSHNYEVGAWLWTFDFDGKTPFGCMRNIEGADIHNTACPMDEEFIKFAGDYIKDVAKTGVDLIMYDDDFRFSWRENSVGCVCDRHLERIYELTGVKYSPAEVKEHILNGKKNPCRDAFLKANGESLEKFAAAMRKALNEVSPTTRLGYCTCDSAWDLDGTNPIRISKLLAGNTRPFFRPIGAPRHGNLAAAIECERLACEWSHINDIEIFSEGDVYPRPRHTCPASYLEIFDTALRVAGCTDGILKYGLDYTSNASFETGYAEQHERNRELYKEISELFDNKESVGIRVYTSMKTLSSMEMSTKINPQSNFDLNHPPIGNSVRILCNNALPTVHSGKGTVGFVCDENARTLPTEALNNGLVIDISAAEILMKRGIDVGIKNIGEKFSVNEEHFLYNNNYVGIISDYGEVFTNKLELESSAQVLSDTQIEGITFPMSFKYENKDGQRFLVINYNSRIFSNKAFLNYERARQIADSAEWLSGNPLPAFVDGSPFLYLQAKENENGLAVGLWNIFADPIFTPSIVLGRNYKNIRCVNCNGKLEGNIVKLSPLPAYGYAFFEVS